MAFIFEQSDSEIYASHAGLAVVGPSSTAIVA